MNRQVVLSRAAFWSASAAAAAYWLLFNWRIEQVLWDFVAWLALVSDSVARVVPSIDTLLVFGFIAAAYAIPPLVFAVCLRLIHVRTSRRTWAIPATGLGLLLVFMGSESLILGLGVLDLLRISTFTDASWWSLTAALSGVLVGSAGSWAMLAPHGAAEMPEAESSGRV